MLRKSQSPLAFSNVKCEIPLLPIHVCDEGEGRGSYACMLRMFCNTGKGDAESAHTKMACCQCSELKHFGLGDIWPGWCPLSVRKKTYVQEIKKDMRKGRNCSTWRRNKQKIGKEIWIKRQSPKFIPAMPMQALGVAGYAGILKLHQESKCRPWG